MADQAIPELQFNHPDGRPKSRLEMDQWIRSEIPKVHWLRIIATRVFHLPKNISWDMREIVLRHWLLDEMVRQQVVVGDQLGINSQNSNDEGELRQFAQRLAYLVQSNQAVQPQQAEGVDMQGFTPPPPPVMGAPNGQPQQQPQQAAYPPGPPAPPSQPPGPPAGGFAPPQPPGPPQGFAPQGYQQQPPPMAPPQQMQQPMGPPGGYAQPPAPPPGAPNMGPPMGPPGAPPAPPQQAAAPGPGRGRRKAAEQPAGAPPAASVPPMAPPPAGAPQGFAPAAPGPAMTNTGFVPAAPPMTTGAAPSFSMPTNNQPVAAAPVDLSPVLAKLDQVLAQNAELHGRVHSLSQVVTVLGRAIYQKQGSADITEFLKELGIPPL